ncbi:MAG: hypothetical protein M1831_001014, partial [Alyxoria varia]
MGLRKSVGKFLRSLLCGVPTVTAEPAAEQPRVLPQRNTSDDERYFDSEAGRAFCRYAYAERLFEIQRGTMEKGPLDSTSDSSSHYGDETGPVQPGAKVVM